MDPSTNVRTGPDWHSIKEEVLCPLCEYDLQGLSEPRCPECGYTFQWQDLLDPTRRLHRYIFEHHPEKGFRSFWKTTAGILRPRRFWRSLHPVQPSCPRRLVLYWLVVMLLSYVFFQATVGACITCTVGWPNFKFTANRAMKAAQVVTWKRLPPTDGNVTYIVREFGSIENAAEYWYPTHLTWTLVRRTLDDFAAFLILPLLWVFWPWMMFATLMIFRWSMRRAKIRSIHALRCCIYTSGTVLWMALAVPVLVGCAFLLLWTGVVSWGVVLNIAPWIAVGWVLVMLYQLSTAYRLYLRFDHSIATVACAQVIAILTLLVAIGLVADLLRK